MAGTQSNQSQLCAFLIIFHGVARERRRRTTVRWDDGEADVWLTAPGTVPGLWLVLLLLGDDDDDDDVALLLMMMFIGASNKVRSRNTKTRTMDATHGGLVSQTAQESSNPRT